MNSRPAWNTAPIRCGRTKCKWRGYEGQLASKKGGVWTRSACPMCGCHEYMFMTAGEIKAWERRKAKGDDGAAPAKARAAIARATGEQP